MKRWLRLLWCVVRFGHKWKVADKDAWSYRCERCGIVYQTTPAGSYFTWGIDGKSISEHFLGSAR